MKLIPSLLVLLCTALAQAQPNTSEPTRLFGNPTVAFAQESFDFATQGIGRPNCVNIPIINRTGEVQKLTSIYSTDGKTFTISSPSEFMLPIELQPGGTMYVSLCFRPLEEKNYSGKYVAVFEKDSSVMTVTGGGMKVELVRIPTRDTLRVVKKKGVKNEYTFEVDLATSSAIELVVSDALGNPLKSYTFGETKQPGPYKFDFTGRDKNGEPLEPGTYYVKLQTINFKGSKSLPIEPMPVKAAKKPKARKKK